MSGRKRSGPPAARAAARRSSHHGIIRRDPYAWLKARNWAQVLKEPGALPERIRRHLEAENAWTAQSLAGMGPLRRRLFQEMKARLRPDEQSVPEQDGPWRYYWRHVKGGEHPLYCRRRGARGGREEVLLDGVRQSRGSAYFRLGGVLQSPDHRLLAWSADRTGGEYFEIRIKDLAAGRSLRERIGDTGGEIAWSADSQWLFYVVLDALHRPVRIMRHRIGEKPERDEMVYEEKKPGFFLSLSSSQSRGYIVVSSHDHCSTEVYVVPSGDPRASARRIAPRKKDEEYWLDHDRENARFLILTNAGGAQDFRIVAAPEGSPGRRNWKTLVRPRKGVTRLAHYVLEDWLVWLEREKGLPRLMARRHRGGAIRRIALDGGPHDLSLRPGFAYGAGEARIAYSSMAVPERIYDCALSSGRRILRKSRRIPGGHDPRRYVTKRLFARAGDGARIPVSLLWRKDRPPRADGPLFLYGYGAYGITIPASFSIARLSLVDRGLPFAIAHVRGGGACGRGWYLDGKGAKKKASFSDFAAAAGYLHRKGLAGSGRIIAHGGSAGGLLMGGAVNLAPDLFRAVIAEVPFVDVLATMLDARLPLTPPEWPEWGNPIASKRAYRVIAAYSPYDNIVPRAYPHILATGGLTDPRVGYWEPAKWVARLRANQRGSGEILLKMEMEAGHGGREGRYARLAQTAFVYAYALWRGG